MRTRFLWHESDRDRAQELFDRLGVRCPLGLLLIGLEDDDGVLIGACSATHLHDEVPVVGPLGVVGKGHERSVRVAALIRPLEHLLKAVGFDRYRFTVEVGANARWDTAVARHAQRIAQTPMYDTYERRIR